MKLNSIFVNNKLHPGLSLTLHTPTMTWQHVTHTDKAIAFFNLCQSAQSADNFSSPMQIAHVIKRNIIHRLGRLTQIKDDFQDFGPNSLNVTGSTYRGCKVDTPLMRLPCPILA
jgi:hypothetical protein